MFGKIVQLLGIPMEDGFRIVYGIETDNLGKFDNRFATISSGYPNMPKKTYIRGGHIVTDKSDGFKDISVFTCAADELSEKDIEEYLFVIIPYSADSIITTAKKLAGRFLTEAILEMRAGDTVTISKGEPETYMAVQAGNEIFLVKKNR